MNPSTFQQGSAIWFDFGGVLSPPIPEMFAAYERKTGVPGDALWAAMVEVAQPFGLHPLAPIELARMTEAEWGRGIAAALGRIVPGIDVSACGLECFGVRWFEGIEVNSMMHALLLDMKSRGYRIGILTNNVVEWDPIWRKLVGLDHAVDTLIDSCRVGVRKPDPAIFALAAAKLDLPAGRNVLIDDLAENCDAARACGWHAIQFLDNGQVTDELHALVQAGAANVDAHKRSLTLEGGLHA